MDRLNWFEQLGFQIQIPGIIWRAEVMFPVSVERALLKALK